MTDWSQILKEHGGIVWQTVRRLINDDADASDCFQETFLNVWEFSQHQGVENWPGLLKRIATMRALDHLRKRRRTTSVALKDLEAELPCERPSVTSTVEGHELLEELRDALASMPADQAEVCCLRYFENFRYEQIADELGITVNHVGVLIHRAKSLLQVRLAVFAPNNRQAHKVEASHE